MIKEIRCHQFKTDPLMPTFSVKNSIIAEVQREDFIRWARTPEPLHRVVPPLPEPKRMMRAAMHAFMRGITP